LKCKVGCYWCTSSKLGHNWLIVVFGVIICRIVHNRYANFQGKAVPRTCLTCFTTMHQYIICGHQLPACTRGKGPSTKTNSRTFSIAAVKACDCAFSDINPSVCSASQDSSFVMVFLLMTTRTPQPLTYCLTALKYGAINKSTLYCIILYSVTLPDLGQLNSTCREKF